jgi:hypothetical protein
VCRVKYLFLFSLLFVLQIFFTAISNKRIALEIREELQLGLHVKCRFFLFVRIGPKSADVDKL